MKYLQACNLNCWKVFVFMYEQGSEMNGLKIHWRTKCWIIVWTYVCLSFDCPSRIIIRCCCFHSETAVQRERHRAWRVFRRESGISYINLLTWLYPLETREQLLSSSMLCFTPNDLNLQLKQCHWASLTTLKKEKKKTQLNRSHLLSYRETLCESVDEPQQSLINHYNQDVWKHFMLWCSFHINSVHLIQSDVHAVLQIRYLSLFILLCWFISENLSIYSGPLLMFGLIIKSSTTMFRLVLVLFLFYV